MDYNKKLTTNFKWGEFWSGDKKLGAKSIEPPKEMFNSILEMARQIQPIRTMLNTQIIIRSGYRTPEWNKFCGGAKSSYHLKGMAVDSKASGISVVKYALYLVRYTDFSGYGVYTYQDFVHSDMRENFLVFKP